MAKSKGQVAGLEAQALATPHDPEIYARRDGGLHRLSQIVMALGMPIVEQLNFQAVAWPVELRGCARHADRKRALVANRELNKDVRKRLVGQIDKAYATTRTETSQ